MSACVSGGYFTLPFISNQKRAGGVKQHFSFMRETECFPNSHQGRQEKKKRDEERDRK